MGITIDWVNVTIDLLHELAVAFTLIVLFLHKFSYNGKKIKVLRLSINANGLLIFSLLAIFLTSATITVSLDPKIVIDLRTAPIVLAGVYLGIWEGLFVAGLTVIIRFLLGGSGLIPWFFIAYLIAFVSWYLSHHTKIRYINRGLLLIILGLISTTISAIVFVMIASFYVPLHPVSPFVNVTKFLTIYLPLFLCNPLAIVLLDYAISNTMKYHNDFSKLKHMVNLDGMTGLYNHRFFQSQLLDTLKISEQTRMPFSLLMIDIDYFKQYNDTYGHQQGDIVLSRVAKIIKNSLRERALVARYGGEEFVAILQNTRKEEAANIAETIREEIGRYPFHGIEHMPLKNLTVSIGISTYLTDAEGKDSIILAADQALYIAKRTGRNRVVAYDFSTADNFIKVKESTAYFGQIS